MMAVTRSAFRRIVLLSSIINWQWSKSTWTESNKWQNYISKNKNSPHDPHWTAKVDGKNTDDFRESSFYRRYWLDHGFARHSVHSEVLKFFMEQDSSIFIECGFKIVSLWCLSESILRVFWPEDRMSLKCSSDLIQRKTVRQGILSWLGWAIMMMLSAHLKWCPRNLWSIKVHTECLCPLQKIPNTAPRLTKTPYGWHKCSCREVISSPLVKPTDRETTSVEY